jgi:hypothetical protein
MSRLGIFRGLDPNPGHEDQTQKAESQSALRILLRKHGFAIAVIRGEISIRGRSFSACGVVGYVSPQVVGMAGVWAMW